MGTTSDQIRPAGRASRRRRRGRGVLTAAWIGAAVAALACGDAGGDPGEGADLERRFGRRPAETVGDAGAGAGKVGEGKAGAGEAGAGEEAEPGEPGRDDPPPSTDADARTPRQTDEPSGAPPPPAPGGPAARESPTTPEDPAAAPVEEAPEEAPPTGAAGAPQEVDLDALLAEAERTYASLSSLRASFVQLMEVPLLERSSTGQGTWYQKGRDRFRMDFRDPPDDEIVADGTHLWLFQPSVQPHQVIRSTLADGVSDSSTPDLLARILSQARTAYRSRYEGRESVAGVQTHRIALAPIGRSQYREVRVWIGDDRLVRRFQILEENESRRTVTLSGLEPNVPLADSLFRFTPPPGVDVFDG